MKDKTCALCGAMTSSKYGLCEECRPPPLTNAERQRAFRARKAAQEPNLKENR